MVKGLHNAMKFLGNRKKFLAADPARRSGLRLPEQLVDPLARPIAHGLGKPRVVHLRLEMHEPAHPAVVVAHERCGGQRGCTRLIEQTAGSLGKFPVLAARPANHVLRTAEPHRGGQQGQ
jgi:hypothetical protein